MMNEDHRSFLLIPSWNYTFFSPYMFLFMYYIFYFLFFFFYYLFSCFFFFVVHTVPACGCFARGV